MSIDMSRLTSAAKPMCSRTSEMLHGEAVGRDSRRQLSIPKACGKGDVSD